ncbi:MAG TPA: protein kinase [Terriglobia bacterium]|nr:protein kinase [Terriglobia bacterium]
MMLQEGTRLGPYEILAPLGVGGMGEVYRARDTKLSRDVALKVLPEALANDRDRMARFEREAQVLASLNHPNIAAIHGLEESSGVRALVMELVEGPTLAERLVAPGFSPARVDRSPTGADLKVGATAAKRAPLQPEEALPIARQIAEALEYAHERGIIHRDLKPANIKITPEGAVKVLDFGLAKALNPQDSTTNLNQANSPTLSVAATQAGVILGTAAYMSPEQAKGKSVDRRADIWAFGCVAYEMFAGRQAFGGETVSDVLAAVITKDPDWNALPAATPPAIERLLRRCMTKDARERLQAIGEARIAIQRIEKGETEPASGSAAALASPVPVWRRVAPWIVAAILIGLAGLAGWRFGIRSAPSFPAWSGDLLPGPTIAMDPLVPPDGRLIAFRAIVDNLTQVAVMDPSSGNWTVLTHDRTQGLTQSLSWSWDGSKIYYDRFNPLPAGVYSVPALGGEPRLVLADAAYPASLPDGSLLLVRLAPDGRSRIYHYWPDSGRLQALDTYLSSLTGPSIQVFPGGKEAVFWGSVEDGGASNSPQLCVLDIATGKAHRRLVQEVPPGKLSPTFGLAVAPDGRSLLVVLRSGDLYQVVSVPRLGKGPVRTLLTLTSRVTSLNAASDGSLYLDQVDRPAQILRFAESGGTPEVLAGGGTFPSQVFGSIAPPVESSDDRVLLPVYISGRYRLLLGKPGGNFVSLLESDEESAPPLAQVGNDEVAFMVGSPPSQSLAIASLKDGSILHRFESIHANDVRDVAGSPDGKTLYYVSGGNVWSIPTDGGTPRKVSAGVGVAVDPNGKDLVVERVGLEDITLERVPLSGGPEQPIPVKGGPPLSPLLLGPNAINLQGRLLVSVQPTDSWFFRAAIIDLATGKMTQIPLNYDGDIDYLGWTRNGRIMATTLPITSHIWRFRPVASGKP